MLQPRPAKWFGRSGIRAPGLLILAGLTLFRISAAGAQGTSVRNLSAHYALERGPGDVATLRVLDEFGATQRTVSLAGDNPVPGDRDYLALVSHAVTAGRQDVQLFDPAGALVSRFNIPAGRALLVGSAGLALFPATDVVGTAFTLELRNLNGTVLGSATRPGLILVGVQSLPGGRWVARSSRKGGGNRLHLFGSSGEPLWELNSPEEFSPVLGYSAATDRLVVGALQPDLRTSRLRLLDGGGRSLVDRTVAEFRAAVFSPDGKQLLLVGSATLQLIDPGTGEIGWSFPLATPPSPGASAAFSRDGTRFYLLAQPEIGGAAGTPQLSTFSIAGARINLAERALADLPAGAKLSVLDLQETSDGRIRLVLPEAVRLYAR